MTTEIQKFDPSSLMQGVKDRIKSTFVSLIPEDHWEQLCKKEVDEFFNPRGIQDTRIYKSDFQVLCRTLMSEIATEKVKEALKAYDSKIWSNTNQPEASDQLKDLLIKHAPEIFASTVGRMFQQVIYNMRGINNEHSI